MSGSRSLIIRSTLLDWTRWLDARRSPARCLLPRSMPMLDLCRATTTSRSCRCRKLDGRVAGGVRRVRQAFRDAGRRCAANSASRASRAISMPAMSRALRRPRAVVSARHARCATSGNCRSWQADELAMVAAAHGHRRDQAGMDRRQSCARRRAAGSPCCRPARCCSSRTASRIKVDAQNGPCKIAGRSIAENAGMADVAAAALLFPKVAKRLRGLVAWVEKPGTHRAGEAVSVRVPEQWIYRG